MHTCMQASIYDNMFGGAYELYSALGAARDRPDIFRAFIESQVYRQVDLSIT
jgi:hypothetical protein